MIKRSVTIVCVFACFSLLLTGCATNRKVNDMVHKNEQNSELLKKQAKQQVKAFEPIQHDKGFWVSGEELEIKDTDPVWLEQQVVVRVARSLSVSEAFSVVGEVADVTISIKPDAMAAVLSGGSEKKSSDKADASESSSASGRQLTLDYSGSKRGLLDYMSGQLGVYWHVVNGVVEFYLLDTRIFHISTLGGSMESSATIGAGGGDSGGAGAASGGAEGGGSITAGTQDVSVTMNSAIWGDLVNIVNSMVSPMGKVQASESLGLISVTDVPPMLKSIADVIDRLNDTMNTQVVIDIRVYSLELIDRDDYQIDWTALFETAQGGGTLALQSIPGAQAGLSSLTATLLSNAPRWKRWKGTNAIVKALSKIGKVSILTSGTMITMNNQIVPINLQRSVTYLASAQSGSISTGVATGPTLTPGTVNTGFQMSVMPRVLDSNRVMLQSALNISSLESLGSISSGTGANALTIQTPEVISRSTLQRTMMKSGETLILTGFEQNQLTTNKQGIALPENILTGGENLAEERKTSLIVMITPHLVEIDR